MDRDLDALMDSLVAGAAIHEERMLAIEPVDGCPCWTCDEARHVRMTDPIARLSRRMVLCPECGNKRCPHATHHDNACTGSNASGQIGSRYGATPW